ncbi:MAG: cytochrome c family protein [Alphaproteobacteria bacterium]|nr:cytochrome c family protein [Alphaproteobacteria bacterium]
MASDLTFNKVAGALLATGLAIAGLRALSTAVFTPEQAAKPGYKVEVAAETGGGAPAPEVPPDWGTVLPKADIAAGQATFAKCQACHSLTANSIGPDLTGVVGRKPGSEPGYSYSPAMEAFGQKQPIWDYQHIFEFIKNPQAYINGTKMTFVGLKDPQDRINVIAFLHTQGSTLPIPKPNPAAAAAANKAGTTGPAGAPPGGTAGGATDAGKPAATNSTAGGGTVGEAATANAGGPAGQGKGAPGGAPSETTSSKANPGAGKKN